MRLTIESIRRKYAITAATVTLIFGSVFMNPAGVNAAAFPDGGSNEKVATWCAPSNDGVSGTLYEVVPPKYGIGPNGLKSKGQCDPGDLSIPSLP